MAFRGFLIEYHGRLYPVYLYFKLSFAYEDEKRTTLVVGKAYIDYGFLFQIM